MVWYEMMDTSSPNTSHYIVCIYRNMINSFCVLMHNTIYKSHIISIRLAVGGYQQIIVNTINSSQLYLPPITRVFTTGFRRSLNKIDKKD